MNGAQTALTNNVAAVERTMSNLVQVRNEIGKCIIGQTDVVDGVLICLVAGGHVLLEGVPGLGKTTLLRTLSHVLDLQYSRIQFTPDLMPGDIIGTTVMEGDDHGHKALRFQPGPVFSNLVLADEINRGTPRTQSALLEAMQERTITNGTTTYTLEKPFLVMATQNPIEMEGTYPLPEAQLDRFLMKILVRYPSRDELKRIVQLTTGVDEPRLRRVMNRDDINEAQVCARSVIVAPHVEEYAIDLVMATQPGIAGSSSVADRYIRFGSSPRGAQALVECGRVLALMRGRMHLSVDDVKSVAPSVLRHRMILNFDAHADGQTSDMLLGNIFDAVRPSH